MQYLPLNLSSIYNHILYHSDEIATNSQYNQKKIYGIPHINNIFSLNKKEAKREIFNIPFLSASDKDIFDNIMSDGQVLNIRKQNIDAIAFLGFSEMGTVCDEVILYSNKKNFNTFDFKNVSF